MNLFELFNRPTQITWITQDSDYWQGQFSINDTQYNVDFFEGTFDGIPCWTVDFSAKKGGSIGWSSFNTGTGDEHTVFSTIVQAVKEVFASGAVKSLHMTPTTTGRSSLYQKMLKRLLPKWQISVQGSTVFAVKPGDKVPTAQDERDYD